MTVKAHLDAAAEYIAVAEAGDAKRAAYEKAADEILAAQAEDPELTKRAIAKQLGKSEQWVGRLVTWRLHDHGAATPFVGGEAQQRYRERQVPTRHEDRVEMAATLLADKEVAREAVATTLATPTASSRIIKHAVQRQERDRLEKARETRNAGALPLPAHMASMVVKMNEFAVGLDGLVDELGTLPEGEGRDAVARAAANLARAAQQWVDWLGVIDEIERPDLEVIEGEGLGVIEGHATRA